MEKYSTQLAELEIPVPELDQENCHGTGLGDLPEPCIASILRLITPRDVARLACVSPTFRDASYSDLVWEAMLPHAYHDVLAQARDAPPTTSSRKEIYDFLSNNRVLLHNGTREFWLDRATGGICQSIGARGLCVIWGDRPEYWTWMPGGNGSRFPEMAFLQLVWWLEIQGRLQCFLSPGAYTLSWRLRYQSSRGLGPVTFYQSRRDLGPVTFFLEATDNEEVQSVCYVTETGPKISPEQGLAGRLQPPSYRWVDQGQWMELDVGEFMVERKDLPVSVSFSLKETDCGFSKHGLYLDGVVIRPSNVNLMSSKDVSFRNSGENDLVGGDLMGVSPLNDIQQRPQRVVDRFTRNSSGTDMRNNATSSNLDQADDTNYRAGFWDSWTVCSHFRSSS